MTARATKPKKATARTSETAEHMALVDFLKSLAGQYPLLDYIKHTPNEALGGGKIVERMYKGRLTRVPLSVLQGGRLGVRSGVWDFEYLGPNLAPLDHKPAGWYRGLAIEMKTTTDLSDEQIRWQLHYEQNGWHTRIFRRWELAAVYCVRWVGGDPSRIQGLEEFTR